MSNSGRRLVMVGAFSTKTALGGESVKNQLLASAFREAGVDVDVVDTAKWERRVLSVIAGVLGKCVGRNRVIFLCSHPRGAGVILAYLLALKALCGADLRYMVVGHDLIKLLTAMPWLAKAFGRFNRLYVETQGMKRDLEARWGLRNVAFIPNFRPPSLDDGQTLGEPKSEHEFKAVFFSRIEKTKGVDTAVSAVNAVRLDHSERPVSLDIWGILDEAYRGEFELLLQGLPHVRYRGLIPAGECSKVLADYHWMLFPTRYGGEVFPGVALEAMAAGVPIMISDWHYNAEVITHGIDGFVLPTFDVAAWSAKLSEVANYSQMTYQRFVERALATAKRHRVENVVEAFLKDIYAEEPNV
jgi:glycosyltransferase involved in cell wall biosynthesis